MSATPYTAAVRERLAELPRHPGWDGPTVCACVECVLFTLVETGLGQIEYDGAVVSQLQDALRAAHEVSVSTFRSAATRPGYVEVPNDLIDALGEALDRAGVSPSSEETE